MKRALLALSLLVLGAVLWWALRGRAVTPGLGTLEAAGAAHAPTGTADLDAPSTLATADAGAVLAPLPALRGEVRDDTGGVAQAAVELNRRGPPGDSDSDSDSDSDCESAARTTTVAGGGFETGPLCPGQYDTRASRNARVATAVVRLARGAPAEPLVLTLRDGTRLTVRVRDEKKAPIAGAEVHAQDAQSGYQADGVTDAKGVATFEGLTPRKHSVWASAPDHLDASLYGRTLAAGEDEVQLTLLTGAHFEGRVVGPDGEAIEGAMVQLGTRRLSARSWDTVGSGLSRDGGAFSVPPVRPGSYTAVTTHDDWVGSEQAVRVPGPRVTLKLSRGASVDGLFLDAHGVPMAEGDINATQLPQGASRNPHLDGWGRFKLEGLARGEWTVIGVAKSQDGGPQGVAVAQLTVKNEQPQTLTLQLLEGVPISGRCVDSKGAPADTDVIAIEQALYRRLRIGGLGSAAQLPPGAVAISACTGRFELTGLKPGRYALLACGNDDDPLLANAGDVDLTLTCQVGELRFRVVDPAGRPVERYAVGYSEAEPFPDGRFARRLPRELEEVLTVRAAGFAPLQRKYAAKRGERVDLGELQLTPARTVTGQVRDQKSGQPLAQVEVRFGFETDEALQRARSGTDGRFELVDVPREAGTLFVSHPRYRLTTVPLGATQDAVQVKLSAGLEVSGAIITRDGREARADGVSAEGPEGLRREAAVSEGRYALGSLVPGSWKLRLSGPMVSGFDVLELTLTGEGAVNADFIERAGGVAVTLLPLDDEGHPVNATGWLVPGRVAVPSTVKGADAQLSGALESEEGPDGTHGFSSVSPGVYTAVIRLRDLPMMWAESFEVHPGMASPLRLVMPRGLAPSPP